MSKNTYGSIHLCPVCHQAIRPTMRRNISAHLDSLRYDTCPGSAQPFDISILVTPEFQGVAS